MVETFEWTGAGALISTAALILSILSFAFTWSLDRKGHRREALIEKSSAYLQLEVHSSEAFRYAAIHSEAMRPYESTEEPSPPPKRNGQAAETTRQYYYQCLNLFEVCTNFRRNEVIHKEVFASWVSWFHEVLDQWLFRELWVSEMRDNYTQDVRNIFDLGIRIYALSDDAEYRIEQFYDAVSHAIGGCEIVENWRTDLGQAPQWPPSAYGKLVMAAYDKDC